MTTSRSRCFTVARFINPPNKVYIFWKLNNCRFLLLLNLRWLPRVFTNILAMERELEKETYSSFILRTFARNFSNIGFFLNILPVKVDELVMSEMWKNWGVTDFVLERTCPEVRPNLRKSGFVSEEDHSGYKSQNIAVELWSEVFSAKYCLNGPNKRI